MFGKLTLDAVPYHEPIIMVTVAAIIIGGAALVGLIARFGKWGYLWNEWLTSVILKLGIMYCIGVIVMLIRGFADAIMMRSQQALCVCGRNRLPATAPLRSDLYRPRRYRSSSLAMPLVIGLMNVVVPLQIGARRCVPVPEQPEDFWLRLSALSAG